MYKIVKKKSKDNDYDLKWNVELINVNKLMKWNINVQCLKSIQKLKAMV